MEGKERIYSCQKYVIYKDLIDDSLSAYDEENIFITCIMSYINIKHFKMIVEDILENGY